MFVILGIGFIVAFFVVALFLVIRKSKGKE